MTKKNVKPKHLFDLVYICGMWTTVMMPPHTQQLCGAAPNLNFIKKIP